MLSTSLRLFCACVAALASFPVLADEDCTSDCGPWRAEAKFTLYDLNSEFDSNATGGLFINPSHGMGKDISQSGRGGLSIFPVSSLGARALAVGLRFELSRILP